LVAALWLPLPYRVYCPLEIQPRDASSVYVEVPGILQTVHVQPGARVEARQPLVTLTSVELEIAIEELQGRRDALAAKLETLRRLAISSDEAATQIAEIQESLSTIEDQLRRRRQDRQRLALTAPVGGTLLAPPARPVEPEDSGRLPAWSGTPLEPRNMGALLEEGAMVCRIGDPARLEATLVIDQSQIEFVAPGQRVEIKLDQYPSRAFVGTIAQVSAEELDVSSAHLAVEGDLATRTDKSGRSRPLSTTYQASVPLDEAERPIVIGGTGQAKIHAGWRTLGSRLWWYLSRTFKLSA
jgi:putative peptide zinc metalloprotease protein